MADRGTVRGAFACTSRVTAYTMIGSVDALQTPPPSRHEPDRDARLRDALDRRAHEDLPGLGGGAQTSGDVDGPADVALGGLDRLAGVDADPDPERPVRFPGVRLGGGLDDLQSAQHGTRRRREHGVDRVALRLDLGAVVASDRLARDLEESADHVGRRDIPMALRERGEATHVGEQEIRDTRWPRHRSGRHRPCRHMVVATGRDWRWMSKESSSRQRNGPTRKRHGLAGLVRTPRTVDAHACDVAQRSRTSRTVSRAPRAGSGTPYPGPPRPIHRRAAGTSPPPGRGSIRVVGCR